MSHETPSSGVEPVSSAARLATGAAIAAVQVVVIWFLPAGWAGSTGLAVAAALAVVQAIALWRQQDRPVPATVVAIAAAAAIQVLYPPIAGGGALPALFGLASLRPPRRSLWALAAVLVFAPFQAWADHWRAGLIMLCSAALAWALGELNRIRAVRRRDEARRIADAERARIARELHDVVAHHVSVVVVQAAAAYDVFDSHPERARTSLQAIESTGRQALAELRRVVQALPLEPDMPAPGLADIENLAESVRAAGVRVEVRRQTIPLDGEVELVAYRVVQESLTNVVRHADARNIEIDIAARDGSLLVEVHNDGMSVQRGMSGTGRGLSDMRRRVQTLGGSLHAAPHDNGFSVRARLPLSAASEAGTGGRHAGKSG
ncbi:MAG: sensor histidine kinase [Stackebrandtia sp.]